MNRFAKFTALASVLLVAGLLGSGAVAQQASPRCDGTLCDLYYGSSGPAPSTPQSAATTAPTPLSVPGTGFFTNMFSGSNAAPAQGGAAQPAQRSPFLNVGGGGLTGSNKDAECGGTICDLFHGHSSRTEGDASLSQSVSGTPMSPLRTETASNQPPEPVAAPAPAAPTIAPQRRVADRAPPKPSCASRAGDPWSCYRR